MNTKLSLFISHDWDRADLYGDLVEILDCSFHNAWENYSITRDNAFSIATDVDAAPQRRQLLLDRLEGIVTRLNAIAPAIAETRERIAEVRHRQRELVTYREIKNQFLEARERILESTYLERMRYLERVQRQYADIDVPATENLLETQIQDWELIIRGLNVESERLAQEARFCRVSLANIDHVQLGESGKARDGAISSYPNLALAIRNKIALADVVLIIVMPYSALGVTQLTQE
jgi:hypothetical protein